MVDRISALAGHYQTGKFGLLDESGDPGVVLQEIPGLTLHQIAAWPESIDAVGELAATAAGCNSAPAPCRAKTAKKAALLRVEPLKWWLVGAAAPDINPEQGSVLDLSHSRTHVRVSGPDAVAFLNRQLSFDLRDQSFSLGSVGSTAIHHVGVTLWCSENGYELFVPRGFALSLWEGFVESATQFGLEVS